MGPTLLDAPRVRTGRQVHCSAPGRGKVPNPRAVCRSAPVGELRIERHAAVDEKRLTVDIVRRIGGEPHGRATDVGRHANAAVRDQLEQ